LFSNISNLRHLGINRPLPQVVLTLIESALFK